MKSLLLVLTGVWVAVLGQAQEPLWLGDKAPPAISELAVLSGVRFHVIKAHEPDKDGGYGFLHGVALVWHKGRLYASFAHNKGIENTATEEVRFRVSEDGGQSWGPLTTLDDGGDSASAVSHGVFLEQDGRLWSFNAMFEGRMKNIRMTAYLLDDSTGNWENQGVVVGDGFWPLGEPQKRREGGWIIAGIQALKAPGSQQDVPAVAVSEGSDPLKWKLVPIPVEAAGKVWGESAVLLKGAQGVNISRWGGEARALVARSNDGGLTWTRSLPSNMPMAGTKPCAGYLSTGQPFLIGTTVEGGGHRRTPLTIAVGRAGELGFRKVYVIRHAGDASLPDAHEKGKLSYPCAVEREGLLYVGYSNSGGRVGMNINSAELAVIPVSQLTAD